MFRIKKRYLTLAVAVVIYFGGAAAFADGPCSTATASSSNPEIRVIHVKQECDTARLAKTPFLALKQIVLFRTRVERRAVSAMFHLTLDLGIHVAKLFGTPR